MKDRKRAVQASVHGRVQGVGYRIWARGEATRLGLTGWVRNKGDGSVTAWLAGTDAAVSVMIERLWMGPAGASISRIDLDEIETWTAPGDFRIVA